MSKHRNQPNEEIRSTADFIAPLSLDPADPDACRELTETLRTYGLAVVKSRHYNPDVRNEFIELMTEYISRNLVLHDDRLTIDFDPRDLREDMGYQYGPTPIGAETALCAQPDNHERCNRFVDRLEPKYLPKTVPGSSYPDRKGRFMSHLVTYRHDRVDSTGDPEDLGTLVADENTRVRVDPENVVPACFSQLMSTRWRHAMNEFGTMMLNPLTEICLMLADGLGLPKNYFVDLMHDGHHKVAPTFASYHIDRNPGIIQAALHEDIDVFAIHAQGTHSGLYVYTETGERLRVVVPEGCFLVQAGRQLYLKMRSMKRSHEIEYPPIQPGWHEVIVTPNALSKAMPSITAVDDILSRDSLSDIQKIEAIRPHYRKCLRISCTFFYHFGDGTELVYGLPEGTLEENTFPEGTKIQRYIGLELGFIKLKK